jgi:hypothetical protein
MATNNALNKKSTTFALDSPTGLNLYTYLITNLNYLKPNNGEVKFTTATAGTLFGLYIDPPAAFEDKGYILISAFNIGNPYCLLSTTTTNWCFGRKDWDLNHYESLCISQGSTFDTNNVFIQPALNGRLMPMQPAFLAYLSSTQSNVFGQTGTTYTVLFDTEVFDIGSCYAPATGIFTCPKTGKYLFQICVLAGDFTISTMFRIQTSTIAIYHNGIKPLAARDTNGQVSLHLNIYVSMTAGQQTSVVVSGGNEAANTNDVIGHATQLRTYWSGTLIC